MVEPAEDDTVVVCLPWAAPSHFADDVRAKCLCCGREVRHRPHVPREAKPMCTFCYVKHATPEDRVMVTRKTYEEVAAYLRRKFH